MNGCSTTIHCHAAGTAALRTATSHQAVQRDDAGILSLRWWPGNEVLKSAGRVGVEGSRLIGIHDECGMFVRSDQVRYNCYESHNAIMSQTRHDP